MDRWDDEHLETLFHRMREVELQLKPSFATMWHDGCLARSRQRRCTILASMALTAALAATAIVGLWPKPPELKHLTDNGRLAPIDFEAYSAIVEQLRSSSAVAWRSPTDYLLEPAGDRPVPVVWWNYEPLTN